MGLSCPMLETWRLTATVNTCKTNHCTKGMCSCIIIVAGFIQDGNTAKQLEKGVHVHGPRQTDGLCSVSLNISPDFIAPLRKWWPAFVIFE